jgi:hypothetical protein
MTWQWSRQKGKKPEGEKWSMPQGADDLAGRPIETLRLQQRPVRYGKSVRGVAAKSATRSDLSIPGGREHPREVCRPVDGVKTVAEKHARSGL